MSSVLDSIRSVQESIERIAKQTGTEHLFGDIGYVLGLDDKDKAKNKSTDETQKPDTQNTSDVSVDKPTTSESKSVTDTIRDILSTVDKIALESGTEHLFENLDEVIGNVVSGEKKNIDNQQDTFAEFDNELSFTSNGSNKEIKRYYQALKYDPVRNDLPPYVYGMECNACCMMYFLQSYGLIPPDMSRKIFEYLFTVLNPPRAVDPRINEEAYSENKSPKNTKGILRNDAIIKPVKNDIFKGLFKTTLGFLKGGDGAIFPSSPEASSILYKIIQEFYKLSFNNNYGFLGEFHLVNDLFQDGVNPFRNLYQVLCEGGYTEGYFELGNTIFIGIEYDGYSPGHYCLIVAPKTASKIIDGIEYHCYPADDPFYGRTNIIVPYTNKPAVLNAFQGISNKKIISLENAVGL